MHHFAFIVISSFSQESLKNLVVMSLQRLVTSSGKKALEIFDKHAASQSHCNSRLNYDDFMNQRTSVARKFEKHTKEEESRYKIRLTSFVDVARFLIMQLMLFVGMMSHLLPSTRVHIER